MLKFLKSFVRDERGVSAIEYTLLATIAVLALAGLGTNYRTAIGNLFSNLYSIVSRN
ncbi:Flp family type IVb pilin [Robbsia sp. KACC 23696]|uniref:Flp family type IVb pilin n=1 Tax=Robbsia sp. KACC 23696 TaxID=3149231 RepID=UPI00325A9590